ncbi:hypothetical protein NMG60_11007421 [Bertholletia excelsa]
MSISTRLIIHGKVRSHVSLCPQPLLLLLAMAAVTPYTAAQTSNDSATSSQYPYANFSPSMVIVIVVLVCAFFFLGLFAIYIRQCVEDAQELANSRHPNAFRFRRFPKGLDPDVIDSFPVFRYSEVKDLKIGKGALECAVCINEFEDEETLRWLPKCDHVFHPDCIDVWLASHSTCPVCRTNLVPTPGENLGHRIQTNDARDEQNLISELNNEAQNPDQISIAVDDDQNRDPQTIDTPKPNRQGMGKFPRSHSTGHSLVQQGENCDRYTLRLPEAVRKQMMVQSLKRTKSSAIIIPTEGSSRRGYRSGGEGSNRGRQEWRSDRAGRSDRWVFTMTPPFFSRNRPNMSPKPCADGDPTGVGSSKLFSTSVKTPFDCLAVKFDGVEQTSTRLEV